MLLQLIDEEEEKAHGWLLLAHGPGQGAFVKKRRRRIMTLVGARACVHGDGVEQDEEDEEEEEEKRRGRDV